MIRLHVPAFALLIALLSPIGAAAQERLCDTQFEDCREPILELIRNEQVGIDVAFWYMQDSRYVTELISRHAAGVPVRVLVDQRANPKYPLNETMLNALRDAGIPMREKFAGPDIMHFKFMVFQGQNVLEFSKANYGPFAFVPLEPNVSYDDETVFFTNDDRLTNSFRRRFDDRWIDTVEYRDFGNMTNPPVRAYPLYPIDPSMNFPPLEDFADRSVRRYDREMDSIDAIVFRLYDDRLTNAMLRAVGRGVPVRIITEPSEYRNPLRVYDSEHVDRMYMGGVQLKIRKHDGLTHEASVIMHGLGEVIFGSSNWTAASAIASDEHNYFYNPRLGKPWFFQWFADQFERKWNDTTNYAPFQPLPPDMPSYSAPMNGSSVQPASVTLKWDGGPWAHFYDIYFGTTSTPPLLAANAQLGSPQPDVVETFNVTNLQAGTTYYWRIVGKTWAQVSTSGPTWSFTTAGGASDTTPFGGAPAAVPGTIQAENFDDGGQFLAYFDTTAGNSLGQYRSTDVDVEATTDTGGGFSLGKTRAGEWLKYTVNVAATDSYQLETRVANVGTGAKFHVEVDGVDSTGPIFIPNTGGWQTWQTITTPGVSLAAGVRVLRVVLDAVGSGGGAGNLNWFRLVASAAPPPPPPPPPPTTPYGGTPAPLPGLVQAENFDNGAEGVAYHDASAGNAGNVYRATDVDLGPTADVSSGGYYLGWTREGEWLKYTVNVTATRVYNLGVRVANVGSGAKFRVEVDGVDVTGSISIPDTGGWDVWQTVSRSGIALSQGQHVIRLVMVTRNIENAGVGNYGYLSFQ